MRRLLRFWREFARRYRGWYLLGIVCLVATNALTVAIPTLVQHAIDALGDGEGFDGAWQWAVAIVLAGSSIIVVRTLSRTLFFNPGRTVEFRVKSALFERLLRLPRAFFDTMRPGDIISRGTNDANAMRALIGYGSLQLFNVAFILLFTIGRMLQMDAELTLLCAGPLAVAGVIMRYGVIALFRLQAQLLVQIATLSDRILESYSGVSVFQAYNALPGAFRRFDAENDRLLDLSERYLTVRIIFMPVVIVIGRLCVVIVLYFGGLRVMEGEMTVGALSAFIAYVNILVAGLRSLGFLIGATQRGYLALGRIYEILDAPIDRPAAEGALPSPGEAGHGIEVRDLTFTYPGASAPALRDLRFSIAPGETLGIFGLTGSGKSTLLNLLSRVYDPPPGTVTLGGVDIRHIPIQEYWGAVAYVGQEPFLFSRSLKENIALAHRAEEADATRLEGAIADAALAVDLGAFPHGLDTVVGERGMTVSGGQRQRTAIARAFYRDFDVLLLDDVMSAVDHATERKLIEAMYRRTARGTTVVVSHRISVLAKADRVIVLDEGRVVAEGPHATLLEGDGPYARAWRLQQEIERMETEAGRG